MIVLTALHSQEDFQKFLRLQKAAAGTLYATNAILPETLESFRDAHAFFIEYEGEHVGTVSYLQENSERACVNSIAVLPDYRRKGIGSEVMRKVRADIGAGSRIDVRFPDTLKKDIAPFFASLGFQTDDADHIPRKISDPDIVKMSLGKNAGLPRVHSSAS